MLGEDVEDQLGAVDDARLQRVLERPLLRGRELVVHEQDLGPGRSVRALQLLELPLAHVGADVGACAMLDEHPDRLDAGGARELRQLGELGVRVEAGRQHREDEAALELGAGRGIGPAVTHDARIMPPVGGAAKLAPRARLLDPDRDRDLPLRAPRAGAPAAARAGSRADRLRQGRSDGADRPADPGGARRGAARADGVSPRGRAAGAPRGGRGVVRAPLRRSARPRYGRDPDVRLQGGDLPPRPDRARAGR